MDQLIERLGRQTDGLDTEGLHPAPTLPSVLRRGRRYAATTVAAGVLSAVGAVGAVAVVGPTVMEQFREPSAPVVLGTPDGLTTDQSGPGGLDAPSADVDDPPVIDDAPDPVVPAEQQPSEAEPTEAAPDADTVAPTLAVLQPADGATVTDGTVTFTGEVEPGASVAVGPYTATVAADGSWTLTLVAAKGENTVTFTATDAAGNVTTFTRSVTYEPVTAAPGPKDAPKQGGQDDGSASSAELTARQGSAELTSAPFTGTYSGTAPAGQKVAVTSQYGNGYGWADGSGAWQVPVTFTPPAGTTSFPVTVKLYEQPSTTRTFTLTTVNDVVPVAFTANQQRGELTGAPYTNTYWGTTTPGTKIKVWSDHGWEYAWADGAGDWEVTVTFTPPAGTTSFPVTARHYDDGSVARTFTLTTVAPAAAPFTAGQQSGTVVASAPTNVYGGTGQPGHEVLVWTEAHGQTTTVVGADGTWAVTLVFTDVSPGDRFDVKARDLTGGTSHWFTVEVAAG